MQVLRSSTFCMHYHYILEDICLVCSLGNRAAPPNILALGNSNPTWLTLDVLHVFAAHKAQTGSCFSGLVLVCMHSFGG